jgi:hypothetical protein
MNQRDDRRMLLTLIIITTALLSSSTSTLSSPSSSSSSSPVIVLVYGELERGPMPSNSTSLATHVVAPLAALAEVAVVVSAQRFRPRLHLERHRDRWTGLLSSRWSAAEVTAAEAGTVAAFRRAGAERVSYSLHDNHKPLNFASEDDPPRESNTQPGHKGFSLAAGPYSLAGVHPLKYGHGYKSGRSYHRDCGNGNTKACLKPHDAPSAHAHLYARHVAFLDLLDAERRWGVPQGYFEYVILCRNDGLWLGPIATEAVTTAAAIVSSNSISQRREHEQGKQAPVTTVRASPDSSNLPPTQRGLRGAEEEEEEVEWLVAVKDCVDWGGLNDKLAVVRRWWRGGEAVMAAWFDTRNAIAKYNYSSVEELLREIAMNDLAPLMPPVKKKKGEKVDLALMTTAATTTTTTTTTMTANRDGAADSGGGREVTAPCRAVVRLPPSALPFVDFYHWLGCAPSKYAHSSRSFRDCATTAAAAASSAATVAATDPLLPRLAPLPRAPPTRPQRAPTVRCHRSDWNKVSILDASGRRACDHCECLPRGLCAAVNDNICASLMTIGGFNRRTSKIRHADCEDVFGEQHQEQRPSRRRSSSSSDNNNRGGRVLPRGMRIALNEMREEKTGVRGEKGGTTE